MREGKGAMFLMRGGGHVPDEGREGTMFLMREGDDVPDEGRGPCS